MSALSGRTALVTGGFGGIGKACVEALRAQGATVAFTYASGKEASADALAFPLDLQSQNSITTCFASVVAQCGPLDILVNNAAVGSATAAAFGADADAALIEINATGNLKMAQAFIHHVQTEPHAHPRKLINVSSVGGGVAVFPGFKLADGMSKAAVAFMTRQLAAEQVHTGLDVFAVCPGATNTPMFQASTLNKMSAAERARFLQSLPKGRLIEPEEIATIIAFLAGPASGVLHGAVIDASMGLGVRPGLMTEYDH